MSLPGSTTPADPKLALKSRLRAEALARRDALSADARATAAEAVAHRPLPVAVSADLIVSAYAPIRSEFNPLPLLRRFADAGARIALPAIAGRGRPLMMRAWEFGAPLVRGQWGIREPGGDAAEVFPDVVIAPLAAFDRRGYRIGYGAGYYDMTIAALRARKPVTAIGVAFAAQEIPDVPSFDYDQRLDFVLTEREMFDCRASHVPPLVPAKAGTQDRDPGFPRARE
jgi:5-formyltetrahydrofolate cyclo-ligase